MYCPKTPEEAQELRNDIAVYRQRIAARKAALARYEAEAVLAANAKNAEGRAALVVLSLAANEDADGLSADIANVSHKIAHIEAALLRYAEERADRLIDLRERELAQRLAAGE